MDLNLLGHVMIGYDEIIQSWISSDLGYVTGAQRHRLIELTPF